MFRKGLRADVSLECHRRARPGGANDGKNGDKFAPFFIIRSTAAWAVVAQPPFERTQDSLPRHTMWQASSTGGNMRPDSGKPVDRCKGGRYSVNQAALRPASRVVPRPPIMPTCARDATAARAVVVVRSLWTAASYVFFAKNRRIQPESRICGAIDGEMSTCFVPRRW